jgi:2-haloacid dehalogenase
MVHVVSRRAFLGMASASVFAAACRAESPPPSSASPSPGPSRIRAVAFDLFTLFDPRTVLRVADTVVPGRARALCEAWQARQFEYTWIRACAGRYVDFRSVTEESLVYAAGAQRVELSEGARATLTGAYERLDPWPDTRAALEALKRAGLVLAPLTNFSPSMIENLLASAGMRGSFDAILSTDRVRTYKPDPRAYELGPRMLGVPREAIAFAAFGGWDAAGARWYGYPTFWVNRLGVPKEELSPGADGAGSTLGELVTWVLGWPHGSRVRSAS